MTPTTRLALALGACLLARPALAAPDRLLAPATGDVTARALTADVAPVAAGVDREPVSISWPIDQVADDLDARPAPHRAESRSCWHHADPPTMAAGVHLRISEAGPLVTLSPHPGTSIDLAALELIDPRGQVHAGPDALRPLTGGHPGSSFSADSALLRLRPDLGAGEFVLRGRIESRVLIHVLERDASTYLSLAPSSDLVLAGDSVHLVARLRDGEADLEATSITGELVAPDDQRSPFALTRAPDGSYRAAIHAPAHRHAPGDLYTLQVHATGVTARGLPVRRTATCALAVSSPTARYTGAVAIEDPGSGGVRIRLGVDVAAASRFAASAVLHGTDHHGHVQPIGVAQAARWLEPGARELVLQFDPATVSAAGLAAPHELRDLRLVDQGRLAPLHRQARALAPTSARQ